MGHFRESVRFHKLKIVYIFSTAFLFGYLVSPPGGFSGDARNHVRRLPLRKNFIIREIRYRTLSKI